ncbi:MAG: hypothetical protein OEX02_07305 [Cyclobacteriaceae bacterium]|nr:hypothetical protein [Cyclobacteriaceae bacterium]
MRLLFIISFIATLIATGCREKFEPKPLEYSKLLTGENSKSWQMIGIQFREAGKASESYELPLDDCVFDDLYIFYADESRTFVIDEGASKCDDADPQIYLTDKWAMINASATLEFTIPILAGFPLPYIVKELSESRLVAEIYFNDDKMSYRMIFKAVKSD